MTRAIALFFFVSAALFFFVGCDTVSPVGVEADSCTGKISTSICPNDTSKILCYGDEGATRVVGCSVEVCADGSRSEGCAYSAPRLCVETCEASTPAVQ